MRIAAALIAGAPDARDVAAPGVAW